RRVLVARAMHRTFEPRRQSGWQVPARRFGLVDDSGRFVEIPIPAKRRWLLGLPDRLGPLLENGSAFVSAHTRGRVLGVLAALKGVAPRTGAKANSELLKEALEDGLRLRLDTHLAGPEVGVYSTSRAGSQATNCASASPASSSSKRSERSIAAAADGA